jgi:hypothetical protein
MDLLTLVLVGVLMALFTGIQLWVNKGRFDTLERGLEQVRSDIAQVHMEMAQIRADLLRG